MKTYIYYIYNTLLGVFCYHFYNFVRRYFSDIPVFQIKSSILYSDYGCMSYDSISIQEVKNNLPDSLKEVIEPTITIVHALPEVFLLKYTQHQITTVKR